MPRICRLLLVLVIHSGCGEPARPDAGVDAGRDAGRDGGPDAARDAGADAGRSDAGSDAAMPNPDWAFVEGLPPTCHIEVARDPGAALPPLRFEPCPGRTGCRRIVVDWPGEPEHGAKLGHHPDTAGDETHAYFTWQRPRDADGRWWWYTIVARDDGVAMVVLRKPRERDPERPCAMTPTAITPSSFAAAVIVLSASGAEPTRSYPVRARFDTPVDAWTSLTSRPAINGLVQEVHTSDTTTVLETPGLTFRYGPDRMIEQLGLSDPAGVDAVVGDDAVASAFADPEGWRGVVFRAAGTTSETLIAATADGEVASLRFDGDEVAWFRLIDRITYTRYTRSELWVSPVGVDLRPLAPRLVSRLAVPTLHGSIGHRFGRVWVAEEDGLMAIFDTTTGERREYRPPPDRISGAPILGPEEVGFPVGYRPFTLGLETIEFIRYDALPVAPVPE